MERDGGAAWGGVGSLPWELRVSPQGRGGQPRSALGAGRRAQAGGGESQPPAQGRVSSGKSWACAGSWRQSRENPKQQQCDLLVNAGLGPGFGLASFVQTAVLGEKGLGWVSSV